MAVFVPAICVVNDISPEAMLLSVISMVPTTPKRLIPAVSSVVHSTLLTVVAASTAAEAKRFAKKKGGGF